MPISQKLFKPILAALLSLLFAGVGHLFLRQYVRGIFFIIMGGFTYMISDYWPRGTLLNMILFVVAAFDAFSFGKRGYGIL